MCGVCAPAGGLPRRCRRGGCQRYPAGGAGGQSPTNPAFSFAFAPIPPPALAERSSRREGGDQGYFMQGVAPLASPGLNPRGTGSPCRCGKLNGGACPGVAGAAGVSGTRRGAYLLCRLPALPLWCPRGGACRLCRLLTLPLTCFLAPIPPAPFPAGRG